MRMCIQSSQPQSGSIISKSGTSYVHTFDTGGSKFGRNFDQTSTLGGRSLVEMSAKLLHWGVEIHSKFPPNFDTGGSKLGLNFDQTSTPDIPKLRPNFDQTSAKPGHPKCRMLVGAWYINETHCYVNRMSAQLRHQTSTKLRPNFGTGGCRNLVKYSIKFRPHNVEV